MSLGGVTIKGDKALQKHFKKMANPEKMFDNDVKATALSGNRDLKDTTPSKTGNLKKAWGGVRRIRDSQYQVTNTLQTRDRKHAIADIVDKGRGIVRPKKPGGRLYIPLSNQGASKKLGGKIPKYLQWGKDFVLAKQSRAYKGTLFIEESVNKSQEILRKKILQRIGKA